MSNPFAAQYPGWCPVCHKRIEEGEEVVFDDEKNVIHAECEDE